jgi:hypothetical protein
MFDDPHLYMRMFGNTTVTLGAASVLGIVDDIEELAQINDAGASAVIEQLTVTIVTGSLAGLEVGSVLTLTGLPGSIVPDLGRTVEVRERYRTQDGHITQLVCREVGV